MVDKKEFEINSPEGAAHQVQVGLFDCSDPEAAFIATLHKADFRFIGNVWQRSGSNIYRIGNEYVLDSSYAEPEAVQLATVISRYISDVETEARRPGQSADQHRVLIANPRWRFGITTLHDIALDKASRNWPV